MFSILKKFEKYQGSRTLEDLKSFVERMKGNAKSDNQAAKEEKVCFTSVFFSLITAALLCKIFNFRLQ